MKTYTSEKEISLVRLVNQRWKLIIAVVLGCIGLAGLATILMPRKYESHMKFLVNNERADLVITPEKNQAAPAPAEVTETQVNSEIEMIKSDDILKGIVRDHQLYSSSSNKAGEAPSKLVLAKATEALGRSLDVSALRKTNIIQVSYRSKDPETAVAVLDDLGDRYLVAHLAAHGAPGTGKFFSEQVIRYGAALTQARAALARFHESKHLFSMPQQQASLIDRFQNADSQYKDVTAQIDEQHSRLKEDARQLAGTSERVTTQVRNSPNQMAVQQLEVMLADLQNKRIEMAMKFKPTDRLVTDLDDQIASTKHELASMRAGKAEEQTTDLNTLHQVLKADYAKGQIEARGLETRRAALAGMRSDYLRQLSEMDGNYVALQTLEQHEKEAQDNYLLYTHRAEEARLADALDREKFSNVAIIEKPVSSPIPVSPRLGLNLAVGAMFGMFLALALAFLLESRGGNEPTYAPADSYDDRLMHEGAYQPASGD